MKKLFTFVSLIAATASFAAKQVVIDPVTRLPIGETIPRLIGPMIDVKTGLPIGSGFGSEKMEVTGIDTAYQEAVNKRSLQRAAELVPFSPQRASGLPKRVTNNQTIPAYGLSPLRTIKSEKQFNEFNKGFDAWKQAWEQGHGFKTTPIPPAKVFGTMTYSLKRGVNQTWPAQPNPRIYSGGLAKLPDHIIEAQRMKENEDKEIRQIIDRSGGGKLRPPRDTDNRMLVRESTIEQLRLKANRRLISYISRHETALVNVNYKLYHFKSIYIKMLTDSTTDENRKKVEVLIKRIESARDIITKQMETYRKQLKYNELLKQKEKNESPK